MSGWDELARLDATGQAELVARKEVTAVELVEAAIERIERLNPRLNAVVTPMYEQALEIARADSSAIGEETSAPFPSVPFLLKDLQAAYAGVRMTAGSAMLRDFVPDHDTELVARLKRAGLIVLGKTNTPEFGILPTTEPDLFGPTRNPWDTERTTGGSSGGAAAAVASGMVPMAHANDGGGSIRIPASCCGVFGLKPTRARNPLGPDIGDWMGGLVAEHAVTRSVRDSAALLDSTSGPDVGDPYWAPPNSSPFLKAVGEPPGRLSIGFTTVAPSGVPIHADCVEAVRDAARLLAELGHDVREATLKLDGELITQAFEAVWAVGVAAAMDGAALVSGQAPQPQSVERLSWALYEMGQRVSGPRYALAQAALQRVAREIARLMLGWDVLLMPTLAEPPLPLGTFQPTAEDPLHGFRRAFLFVPNTYLFNVTGQPAMSVPLYWNAQGLPVGTHFIGRFGDEATLFRLAAQLEAARPWTHRKPPVSA